MRSNYDEKMYVITQSLNKEQSSGEMSRELQSDISIDKEP